MKDIWGGHEGHKIVVFTTDIAGCPYIPESTDPELMSLHSRHRLPRRKSSVSR